MYINYRTPKERLSLSYNNKGFGRMIFFCVEGLICKVRTKQTEVNLLFFSFLLRGKYEREETNEGYIVR